MVSKTVKSLEAYRRAAVAIRRRTGQPTVPEIARELGFSQHKLDALTPEWRGYVGVVSFQASTKQEYLSATDTLRALGKPRTLANLAQILNRSFETVREYIETHADVASYCDVVSRYDSLERAYEEAARRIDSRGRAKTRKELAFELGVPYKTVAHLLSARPALSKRLGIVGRAGSGKKKK